MDDQQKVAVITGASSGIGAAIARRLCADNYRLLISALPSDDLDKIAEEVVGRAAPLNLASDKQAPEKLATAAFDAYGRIDVLINNAGMMVEGFVDEIDTEKVRLMLRLNVEASVMMGLHFAKLFKAQGSGHIINISSMSGYKTMAKMAAYNASKHAIEGFTDALRLELAGTGVKAHAIAPGTVATALYNELEAERRDYLFSGGALHPNDIADVAQFLLARPQGVLISRVLVVPSDQPT